ncbi:zinc-dependent alcohol dehydrogenase family protein [Zavarzinella formosa]|uniref:zinc-dependent alcohol dehydrogenase family protein n=1 Tax=Zavarzinella formosa TaxID=360055 RepID=UPI0002D49C0C|nr:NAD(P)-dependent alcohol dehydrogenase [Zavarzinella formosa]
MKAWIIADQFGIEHLQQVDRPTPVPGPGEVLVKIQAVSLNYRDLLMIAGQYSPKLPRPRIPGSDGSGEVLAIGPGVTRFKTGDRVTGTFFQHWIGGPVSEENTKGALGGPDLDGVMAQEMLFREEGLIPTPGYLSDEEGATLPCAAATAWNALAGNNLKAGETVLLQGTGGVSLFALRIAKIFGAIPIIISSSDEKLERAKTLGAVAGLNYRTTPDWDKWARKMTDGRGVDHVVEVGGAGTLEKSAKATRVGGHIALIGVLAGGTGANPMPILMKSLNLRGIFVGSREMFTNMLRAFEHHQEKPVIDKVFGFDEFPAALRHMESGSHFGKVVVSLK